MVILGCLVLAFWLVPLPFFVGGILADRNGKDNNSIAYRMMAGNMLLWALFQLICVPCIIGQRNFKIVVFGYLLGAMLLFLIGCIRYPRNRIVKVSIGERKKVASIWWLVFAVLLLVQLVCAVVLAYADGDDAFYVAVSEITNNSNTMYQKSPYSTGVTELDIRHGLAPFPIWIAFLARISGFHTAIVSHVVVAGYLIGLSYMAFYLVCRQLFGEKKEYIPVFLSMTSLLVLFGDYSSRTPENFMIARSRQGKAAIGSIIIPILLFLLFVILQKINEEKKVGVATWGLLTATITSACLCTTLGTFLSCAMVGCVGICVLLVYKRLMPVVKMALCCIPAVVFALLYFVLG